jgi:hypothetical protein
VGSLPRFQRGVDGTRPRTVTRTLRLESRVDDQLGVLARRNNVSINLIVNQALAQHLEWSVPSENFRFMSVASSSISELLNLITDEQARRIGRGSGAERMIEFVTFFFKKFDLEKTLEALQMIGPKYGKNFQFDHSIAGKIHTIIIRHARGPRTSAYYSEAFKAVFEYLGMNVHTTETEDQVTMRLSKGNGLPVHAFRGADTKSDH